MIEEVQLTVALWIVKTGIHQHDIKFALNDQGECRDRKICNRISFRNIGE
jgi:hypothetical protein